MRSSGASVRQRDRPDQGRRIGLGIELAAEIAAVNARHEREGHHVAGLGGPGQPMQGLGAVGRDGASVEIGFAEHAHRARRTLLGREGEQLDGAPRVDREAETGAMDLGKRQGGVDVANPDSRFVPAQRRGDLVLALGLVVVQAGDFADHAAIAATKLAVQHAERHLVELRQRGRVDGAERSAAQKLQKVQGAIGAAERRRLLEQSRRLGEILGDERAALMQLAQGQRWRAHGTL